MFKWAEIRFLIFQSAITVEASRCWLDHFCPLLWRYKPPPPYPTSRVPAYACYMAGLDYREDDVTMRLAEPALHRRHGCSGYVGNHANVLSCGRDLLRTSRDGPMALSELVMRLKQVRGCGRGSV